MPARVLAKAPTDAADLVMHRSRRTVERNDHVVEVLHDLSRIAFAKEATLLSNVSQGCRVRRKVRGERLKQVRSASAVRRQ